VISIVVAPSSCCVTAPPWRCDAGSGSHPPHLLSGNAETGPYGRNGRSVLKNSLLAMMAEYPRSLSQLYRSLLQVVAPAIRFADVINEAEERKRNQRVFTRH
jgi:hypothetical protein